MTWQDSEANGWVHKHTTSLKEIDDLRSLIERDLKDASIEGLSDDRRFATAYNAALQMSKMAIAVAGYRLAKGVGGHHHAFETVKIAIPTDEIEGLCDYFDRCRRKRNDIDYDSSEVVTLTETVEIIEKAQEYAQAIELWVATKRPDLKRSK